jgi:hypothetical protein
METAMGSPIIIKKIRTPKMAKVIMGFPLSNLSRLFKPLRLKAVQLIIPT